MGIKKHQAEDEEPKKEKNCESRKKEQGHSVSNILLPGLSRSYPRVAEVRLLPFAPTSLGPCVSPGRMSEFRLARVCVWYDLAW